MTEFEKLDKDNNGHIDKKEFQALELEDRRLKIQDADEKRNTEEEVEAIPSRTVTLGAIAAAELNSTTNDDDNGDDDGGSGGSSGAAES